MKGRAGAILAADMDPRAYRSPPGRWLLPCLVAAALHGQPLAAQGDGGRYLPPASWSAPWVEYLFRAGVLVGLDPVSRPLRRGDVARALAAADTSGLPASVRRIVRRLGDEFAEGGRTTRWTLGAEAGFTAASDAARDPLRPGRDSAGVYPAASFELAVETPHLALVTTPMADNRLRYDPRYAGKKDRALAGRNAGAYALTSWPWLDAFYGQVDRNWGPPETDGLFLSSVPYATDHLFLRLGPSRLRIELLAEQLDPLLTWDSAATLPRWMVTHRLVLQPSPRLVLAFNEATVYGSADGFAWRFLNPLNLHLLAMYDAAPAANAMVGADVSWLARGSLRVFGQLMIDDLQVDRRLASDREPAGYAVTAGATGAAWRGAATWTALYTRVTNLAYRTPERAEQYTLLGAGLARERSDYDQATVRAEGAAGPGLLIGGEVSLLRQGEGDFRLRYPDVSAFADSLGFLTGTVERTLALGASARWTPAQDVTLGVRFAHHALRNAGHVAGATDGRWVWRVQATIHRRFTGAIGW